VVAQDFLVVCDILTAFWLDLSGKDCRSLSVNEIPLNVVATLHPISHAKVKNDKTVFMLGTVPEI
jgi:hypothetical protein